MSQTDNMKESYEMYHSATIDNEPKTDAFFSRACVLDIEEEGVAQISLNDSLEERVALATVALERGESIQRGDSVLVVGSDVEDLYIIRILNSKNQTGIKRLTTKEGTQVEVRDEEGIVAIYSAASELIFEYNATEKLTRLHVPEGDLALTSAGNIQLAAANSISIQGRRVQVSAFSSPESSEDTSTQLELTGRRAKITSQEINMVAKRWLGYLYEARFIGKRCAAKFDEIDVTATTVRATFGTVVEKAKRVYCSIEGLFQLQSGRIRTIVESAYHLKTKSTNIKSDKGFKVNSEKIHLN